MIAAVTYSFADPERGVYGLARLGSSEEGGSALAVVFRAGEPVAVLAEGAVELSGESGFDDLSLAGLRTRTEAAGERWRLDWAALSLEFEAISSPASFDGSAGMSGSEQLCRVRGSFEGEAIEGLGQRSDAAGDLDWTDLDAVRTVSVWLGEGLGGIVLTALRPSGAHGHDEEGLWSALFGEEGDPVGVADPRLSTTYDGDGHQRRVGLELWVDDEDPHPHRAAGEIVCGSSLDLGRLRLDCAFMRWHYEGATGVGRYDILRRV